MRPAHSPGNRRARAKALAGNPGPYEVVVADGTHPAWAAGSYDRVLVDVPCTGLGALRRHPEARWRRSAEQHRETAGTAGRRHGTARHGTAR